MGLRRQQDGELDAPEDEMRHHLLRRDADGGRNMVRDVQVAGPDGSYALCHRCRASIGLNSVPE